MSKPAPLFPTSSTEPMQKIAALIAATYVTAAPLQMGIPHSYYGDQAYQRLTQYYAQTNATVASELDKLFAKILSQQIPPDHEIDALIAANMTELYQYGF